MRRDLCGGLYVPRRACGLIFNKRDTIEHTTPMKNNRKALTFKKVLPSLILLAAIAALAALSFLPSLRAAPAATVRSATLDESALAALSGCRAYLDGHDFDTSMSGSIRAKVFGIPYVQKVSGGRSVRSGNVVECGESASAFAKAAVKTEYRDGTYYVTRGDYRSKTKSFAYGTPVEFSRADYTEAYGKPVTGLVKYELDDSIVSAARVDENTYTFVLDPTRAAEYSRRAVKTALDSKSCPEYSGVEFTLVTDGSRPLRVVCREHFRADKFGGTHCDVEYTEVFEYSDGLQSDN